MSTISIKQQKMLRSPPQHKRYKKKFKTEETKWSYEKICEKLKNHKEQSNMLPRLKAEKPKTRFLKKGNGSRKTRWYEAFSKI